MPSPSVLAVVPAKMSSQRFPEKNMACLGGRPLLWYTLTVAFRAAGVDRVVVSSESQEILEFAARLGAAVRERPPALSAPHVRNEMVVQDVLASEMETVGTPEYVLLLQPKLDRILDCDDTLAARQVP